MFGNKECLRRYKKSEIAYLEVHNAHHKSGHDLFESVDIVFKDGHFIPIPKLLISGENVLNIFKGFEKRVDEDIDVHFLHVNKHFKCGE
jgi:hypothetical protein